MSARDSVAVLAGKLCAAAIRVTGTGLASNLPGRVSRAISPMVLRNLASRSRNGVIAVSGTNGKSTTAGFVASILDTAGMRFVHNRQGANMVPGVTASLVDAASWTGQLKVDYCLFEIDEAALPLVAAEVEISRILVTNLFRDQLDRFGELDTTANLIAKGIDQRQSLAILNADDPNVAKLAPSSKRLYYGLESLMDGPESAAPAAAATSSTPAAGVQELAYCPNCGSEYIYDKVFYGQLGHYKCGKCSWTRPAPEVVAQDIALTPSGSTFTLRHGDKSNAVTLSLPGLFNVYNAVAAAAMGFSLGLSSDVIARGLSEYTTLFGRSERVVIDGKTCLIQLIKNPAGASQAVRSAVNDPDGSIMIAINDNYADGRDISWLWDAEFELLGQHDRPIVVSGTRCYDMAVRLKYCGIPAHLIVAVPDLEDAWRQALKILEPGKTLWMLPTYTCLLELQKISKAMGHALSGT